MLKPLLARRTEISGQPDRRSLLAAGVPSPKEQQETGPVRAMHASIEMKEEMTMATKKSSQGSSKGLEDLFYDGLKDIYYAERKILTALRKMAKGAESEELKAAFEKHRDETEGQIERLQQVFDAFGRRAQGKTCPAIDGIIEEGQEILEEFEEAPALDAGLVAAAQSVEHYEIARYGTLVTWAGLLGLKDAVPLLEQTLKEEKATDEALTRLGETGVNERAMQQAA